MPPRSGTSSWPGCAARRAPGWETRQRASYRCDTAEPSVLEWDNHVRPLNDWAPYNALIPGVSRQGRVMVSDVRVASTIVPDDDGLETTLEIEAQGHRMEFIVADGRAEVRMRSSAYGDDAPDEGWVGSGPVPVGSLSAGEPTSVDCWHVDQRLGLLQYLSFGSRESCAHACRPCAAHPKFRRIVQNLQAYEQVVSRTPIPKQPWPYHVLCSSFSDRDCHYWRRNPCVMVR